MSNLPPLAANTGQSGDSPRLSDMEELSPSISRNNPGIQPTEKSPGVTASSVTSDSLEETKAHFIANWTLKVLGFLGIIGFGI
jgi:hypothetical protein